MSARDDETGGYRRRRLATLARRLARGLALGLVVAAGWCAAVPGSARADEPAPKDQPAAKPKVSAENVYVGNAANFSKPAQVDADAVYAAIPEYKKILEEGLEQGTARYDLLISKASKRFFAALRAVQKDGGYDLVARPGTVSGVDSVPDITQDVIAKL